MINRTMLLTLPRRITRKLGFVAFACLVLTGCGRHQEVSSTLANESRLPRWFTLQPDQARGNVTVTMVSFMDKFARKATFTLRDSSGSVISKVTGLNKTPLLLQRREKLPGYSEGYPSYQIISVGEITEIIEHRKLEPIFYVTDDPEVKEELKIIADPAFRSDSLIRNP